MAKTLFLVSCCWTLLFLDPPPLLTSFCKRESVTNVSSSSCGCCGCGCYQDKRLKLSLNGNRKLIGTLRGYDAFLNVVLEDAEQAEGGAFLGQVVIRGNSIIQFEALERVSS